jgi:hypothetical protein
MKLLLHITLSVALLGCTNSAKQAEQLKKENQQLRQERNEKAQAEEAEKARQDHYENLIGNWFTPHAAMVNMKFMRDKTFTFNDYNADIEDLEELSGHYELEGKTLTLYYNDRPKQRFSFKKGVNGDDNYYITKTGYYFVKGMNGEQ